MDINGRVAQWGKYNLGNNNTEGVSSSYSFPISFASSCYTMQAVLVNTDTNAPNHYDSNVQPRSLKTSTFTVYKQICGADPWFSDFYMFAIGK